MPKGPTGLNGKFLPIYTQSLTDGTEAIVYNGEILSGVDVKAASNQGAQGDSGWSPGMELEVSGAGTVLKITSVVGGGGSDPGTGEYLGATGHEALVGNGVDIRGIAGVGSQDVLGPASSVDGRVAVYEGSSGGILDSGIDASTLNSWVTETGYMTITAPLDLNALVTSVAANTSKTTNATHTGDVTGATVLTIAAGAVTAAMLETVGTITPGAYSSVSITVNDQGLVILIEDGTIVNNPVGTVLHYAGSSIPSGWLKGDGSAVSRTTYSDLFAVIGTTYGVGDGSTTFNLPDGTGRIIQGQNGADIGDTDGSETHQVTVGQMPSHNHSVSVVPSAEVGELTPFPNRFVDKDINSTNTNSAGSDTAHNNVMPGIILDVMIKT